MLMNVGPTHDGRIIPIFEERLMQMGKIVCRCVCNQHVTYNSGTNLYCYRELAEDKWRGHLQHHSLGLPE